MTDELWQSYARGVKRAAAKKTVRPAAPVRGKTKPAPDKAPHRTNAARIPLKLETLSSVATLPASTGQPLDRKREKAMREGNIEIDARLDLHGKTQVEAFEALMRFVRRHAGNGARMLLIITGKGSRGDGVLRRHLPQWLAQLPEAKRILAIRPASIAHGGDGAFYILLRRP